MERGFGLTVTNEGMHALAVSIPRSEKSRYPMGRGEYHYPRRGREPLSDWEKRMSLSQDERGVSLTQEERRVSLSQVESITITRGDKSVPIPRGEQIP